ncbi:OLC1v1027667C1 [Oldenlandia corymbosa var. corymbosa]|uniref:OLC1v1027667C1 n=1 Tax=Oldenlandia corymbosa var. corymbosa TaxID=529605 RepID=A0AAV1CBV9_OLDCO|nr:OLC1v1027667C1 [Oldenlandia corymbosa var. corymbosa]
MQEEPLMMNPIPPDPTPATAPPPPMSFRDKILQGKRWMEKPMFEEDLEIVMEEDDLIFDKSGPMSRVIVSERVEEQLIIPRQNVLIVKPMGLSLTFNQI